MESVSAAGAGEAAPFMSTAAEVKATDLVLREGANVATEAREALLGEQGLLDQLDAIKHGSRESVAARNEAALREVSQIERNRCDGAKREEKVRIELEIKYPEEDGYHIEDQCSLRDETGKIAFDPVTGESRRSDIVVIKDGQVVRSVEVTSETAYKTAQLAKEYRIREAGGNFVLDRRTGELVPLAPGVKTEIVRRA